MKMIKILLIVLLVVVLVVVVVLMSLSIHHRIKLKEELELYQPLGHMVDINDKKMHVYMEGEGENTFVFMSGHGTSSPTIDFKPLWKKLSENNKVVVVEKFGYGFSDSSNHKKDIDTLLKDTREALSILEVTGPFVLVPHSFSGLEAIYWAQKYPEEVKAIIGLDACTPETIELLPIPSMAQLNLVYLISRIGLSRFMPEEQLKLNLPLLGTNEITDHEALIYKSMFYKSSLTKDMLAELKSMDENAQHVLNHDKPLDTPMYFFISSKQNDDIPGWTQALTTYLEPMVNKQSLVLETSHYVHHEMSDVIANEIMVFVEAI